MQEVKVERPVEVMRDVVIEKPVTTYERREMAVPQATVKDVNVQVRILSAVCCLSHLNHAWCLSSPRKICIFARYLAS